MDGTNPSWYGAVGAIEGVRHPISVARKILDQRKGGLLSLGRVPPMLLVGEGARKFGELSGVALMDKEDLVTDKSRQAWQKYTLMVQTHNINKEQTEGSSSAIDADRSLKRIKVDPELLSPSSSSASTTTTTTTTTTNTKDKSDKSDTLDKKEGGSTTTTSTGGGGNVREKRKQIEDEDLVHKSDKLQDTVGAIGILWRKCTCKRQSKDWCDCGHTTAAGVSSGGILMKFPGRIGEAAVYGAGCWAQQYTAIAKDGSAPLVHIDPEQNNLARGNSVACSTTGTGEQLMQTMLAWNTAHSLKDPKQCADEALKGVFDQFLRHQDLQPEKFGGVIGCEGHVDEGVLTVEGIWGHTTESMALGYFASGQKTPKTFVSRLSDDGSPVDPGFCVNISSKSFRFTI